MIGVVISNLTSVWPTAVSICNNSAMYHKHNSHKDKLWLRWIDPCNCSIRLCACVCVVLYVYVYMLCMCCVCVCIWMFVRTCKHNSSKHRHIGPLDNLTSPIIINSTSIVNLLQAYSNDKRALGGLFRASSKWRTPSTSFQRTNTTGNPVTFLLETLTGIGKPQHECMKWHPVQTI